MIVSHITRSWFGPSHTHYLQRGRRKKGGGGEGGGPAWATMSRRLRLRAKASYVDKQQPLGADFCGEGASAAEL